jgi:hypothetical protein
MRFYLEYINYLGRLRKKNVIRRSESGFSIAEVLLAGLIMLIAILVAGIGVINLLRSNYRANADSEIQNNLNQTLEFVSNDVRQARIIADSPTRIVSTQVPVNGKAVLAFYIPSVTQPDQTINQQIVYYTKNPENNLTGPRVLWRYGPDLDENGNYDNPENIGSWKHSPITDMLADATNNSGRRDCDPFRPGTLSGWQRLPANNSEVEGFYACVRSGGRQVILNVNAQVNMTTNDAVKYAVSTRVTTRATDELWFRPPSVGTPPVSVEGEREEERDFDTPREIIIPTRDVEVIGELIEEPEDQPCRDCFIDIRDPNNPRDLTFPFSRQSDATVQVQAGNDIIVSVQGGGLSTLFGNEAGLQNVDLYTYERQPISDSNSTSRHSLSETTRNMVLTRNQVLVVITDITTANKRTYAILVDITPST